MARPVLKVKGYEAEQIKALFKKDERYTICIQLYGNLSGCFRAAKP